MPSRRRAVRSEKVQTSLGANFGWVDIRGGANQTYQQALARVSYEVAAKVNAFAQAGCQIGEGADQPGRQLRLGGHPRRSQPDLPTGAGPRELRGGRQGQCLRAGGLSDRRRCRPAWAPTSAGWTSAAEPTRPTNRRWPA